MYNQETKERFLQKHSIVCTKETIEKYARLFRSFQPFEVMEGKDVAQMDPKMIADILLKAKSNSFKVLKAHANMMGVYRNWCVANNVLHDCNNEKILIREGLDESQVQRIKSSFFVSPAHFLETLNALYPPDRAMPISATLCLAWCGLTLQEACDLKDSQIDVKNGIVYDGDGNIIISNIDIPIRQSLANYQSITEVKRFRYNATKGNTDFFLKPWLRKGETCENEPITPQTLRIALSQSNIGARKTGKQTILIDAVQKSGGLYRMRRLELDGIDLKARKSAKLVRQCFRTVRVDAKDYLALYDQYKKAFNIY